MLDTTPSKVWAAYISTKKELTFQAAFLYGTIFFATWLLCKLLVFPYLSPLRKIPGRPRGNLLLGNVPEILRKEAIDPFNEWVLEMKTGIIRFHHLLGSQRVVIADAEAMRHVLVTNANNYRRPTFLYGFIGRIVGRSLLTTEGEEHRVHRRLCDMSFTPASFQTHIPTIEKCTERLCKKWERNAKATEEEFLELDITDSLTCMSFDIISSAVFGFDSNSIDNPDENVFQAFNAVLASGSWSTILLRLLMGTWYRILPTKDNAKFEKSKTVIHSVIQNIINNKQKHLDKENPAVGTPKLANLLDRLLLALDVESGVKLSETQLLDHVITFMLAGHETIASNLSWALLSLSQHPDIQQKVRQEVMSLLPPSGQPITYSDIEKLAYLNCVVKETLRLYPAVSITSRQAIEDDVICKHPVPSGTVVVLSLGALHRNPAYWKDPEKFIPERFQERTLIPLPTYQPFLSGPHMCIGYKVAMLELRLALAILLRKYEFSLVPGSMYAKKQLISLRPEPALKLRVRRVYYKEEKNSTQVDNL